MYCLEIAHRSYSFKYFLQMLLPPLWLLAVRPAEDRGDLAATEPRKMGAMWAADLDPDPDLLQVLPHRRGRGSGHQCPTGQSSNSFRPCVRPSPRL